MDLQLGTPRLVLTPLTLGDVGALRALAIDPDVRRWMCDGQVYPEAKIRGSILRSIEGFRWRGAGMFAVRSREDGAFVGYAGLKMMRLGLELGAGIWPRYWRKGLAAEACRAVLEDAFARLGAPRVVACTDGPNFRSLALIARLGFRPLTNGVGAFGVVRWFELRAADRERTAGPAVTPS
jgi:RimJ/RimL family protein N-acetyltransferase